MVPSEDTTASEVKIGLIFEISDLNQICEPSIKVKTMTTQGDDDNKHGPLTSHLRRWQKWFPRILTIAY